MDCKDTAKLERLYELYEQPMYRIAFAVLKNSEQAEDAVSDAFVRIMHNIRRIGEPESSKTKNLIIRIIKNASIDVYRKRRRHYTVEVPIEEEAYRVADSSGDVEKEVLGLAESGRMEELLGSLDEPDRSIVTMRCCEELPWKEVSEKLGLSEQAVRKRFERIRKKTCKNERRKCLMKNKLPNKNEWNEIAEKAFSDYEEHRFSERYLQKKDEIKRGAVMKRMFIDPEKMFIGLTAAAVLAVAAVPTAILIGSRNNSSDKDEKQYSAESIELTAKREKGTYRIPSEVGIPEKDLDIYGIGDTLALGDDGVSITIDNACIQDDLGDFTKLRMGESGYYPLDYYPNLSPYDENGKLSVYYEWFGENDTEKSCGKDTVPLKVMVVEATIRNNSDISYSKYAMDPVLFTVQNGFAGGLRQAFKGDSIAAAHSDIMGYEIDRVSSYMVSRSSPIDDVKALSDDDYYFSSIPREDDDDGKMLFELEAGHAEKVKIAFMFNEDFVGNLYFKLSPRYTLAAEPTGDTDCRVVDLCNIK